MLDLVTDILELKYNTNLKTYNTKVTRGASEVTLLFSSPVRTLCSLVSKQRFIRSFSIS